MLFADTYRHWKEVNPTPNNCPPELLCTEEEILDLLLSLDITKANGPDGISATMLKSTANTITHSITILFNRSIQLGALPEKWKLPAVNPIHKSGAKDTPKKILIHLTGAHT